MWCNHTQRRAVSDSERQQHNKIHIDSGGKGPVCWALGDIIRYCDILPASALILWERGQEDERLRFSYEQGLAVYRPKPLGRESGYRLAHGQGRLWRGRVSTCS